MRFHSDVLLVLDQALYAIDEDAAVPCPGDWYCIPVRDTVTAEIRQAPETWHPNASHADRRWIVHCRAGSGVGFKCHLRSSTSDQGLCHDAHPRSHECKVDLSGRILNWFLITLPSTDLAPHRRACRLESEEILTALGIARSQAAARE